MDVFKTSANEWVTSRNSDSGCEYTLLDEKDSENRLHFSVNCQRIDKSFSFFVTCPDGGTSEPCDQRWGVWSENGQLQPHLQPILEYCDTNKKKTMSDVLDKMDKAIGEINIEEDDDDDEEEDDEDCMDDYYDQDDDEEVNGKETKKEKSDSDDDQETFFGGGASPAAFQRLAKDMRNMKKEAHKFGIEGNPRGDNLFIWDVKLTGFPKDTPLGKDIVAWAQKCKREPVVYLEMQFPGEYPMAPPFVRVTRPRFKFLTGHVTIGGSICMEMLTKSGWMPTNDIESILVQIRSEILSDPNTRLDSNPDKEYGETEARDAFRRMVDRYGWNK